MESKTIKKIIKQYKRGKAGYVQRVDFNKSDKLNEGQIIHILTEKQLNQLEENNDKEIAHLKEQKVKYDSEIKELNNKILILNEELIDIVEKKDKTITEKDKIITDLNKQLNLAINDKNNFKDTIAGLHILIGKYKNRNLLERLLNKIPILDNEDQKLIEK